MYLEHGREKHVGICLSQNKQQEYKQHHGRIDCPGMDWNAKDLSLGRGEKGTNIDM